MKGFLNFQTKALNSLKQLKYSAAKLFFTNHWIDDNHIILDIFWSEYQTVNACFANVTQIWFYSIFWSSVTQDIMGCHFHRAQEITSKTKVEKGCVGSL